MARPSFITYDQALTKILSATLPTKVSRNYTRLRVNWLRHKGPEWLAEREKAIYNIAMLYRAGSTEQIPIVCQEKRIALGPDGLPKGIEGVLVRLYAEAKRPSVHRRISAALRSYTSIRLRVASESQIQKSKSSITTPFEGENLCIQGFDTLVCKKVQSGKVGRFATQYANADGCTTGLCFSKSILPQGSPQLQLDMLSKLKGTSSYPSLIPRGKGKEPPYASMVRSLISKGKVPRALVEYYGDPFLLQQCAEEFQMKYDDPTFGRIVILQEGGAKGRTVCSPNAWIQFYMYPLHTYLMKCILDLERESVLQVKGPYGISCVLDQLRGVYFTLNRLNSGAFCAGVDLSSATDRFPLGLQQILLRQMGLSVYADVLEELRGPYWGPDGELWWYMRGQPMGLYGSFPLFHLTHYYLLADASQALGLTTPCYAVLGDDVIITDEELYHSYIDMLTRIDVPISRHKSYQGDLVEFAGFTILKLGSQWYAYRPYKHQPNRFSTLLNVLHAVGSPVQEWSAQWWERYSLYQSTLGMRSLDLNSLLPPDDFQPVVGLPGSRWFGRLMNQVELPETMVDLPSALSEAWVEDRLRLLKEDAAIADRYSGTFQYQYPTFDPEAYQGAKDFHSGILQHSFTSDPLIREEIKRRKAHRNGDPSA